MGSSVALSESELEVLKVLWELEQATVRDVNTRLTSQGRRWAYTTVQTLLGRLQSKGYVDCDKLSMPHVFRASVSRERLLRARLVDLAAEFCEGASSPLVQALVEGQRFSAREIAHFRRLLDEISPPLAESAAKKSFTRKGRGS